MVENNNKGGGDLLYLLIGGCAVLASWLIYIFFKRGKVNKYTKNIVIMGARGAGKTTLWHQLRGDKLESTYASTTAESIKTFSFKTKSGEQIEIVDGVDYGGSDDYVKAYLDWLSDNTFVFYLIDLTNLTEQAGRELRARLEAIVRTFQNKKMKGQGIKLLATNFGKYSSISNKTRDDAKYEVMQLIGLEKFKKLKIKDKIKVVELRDPSDIDEIKEELAKV